MYSAISDTKYTYFSRIDAKKKKRYSPELSKFTPPTTTKWYEIAYFSLNHILFTSP